MAHEWYYSEGSERRGPIDSATLKKLASTGKIQPETLVWRAGMQNWVKAKTIKALFLYTPPLPDSQQVRSDAHESQSASQRRNDRDEKHANFDTFSSMSSRRNILWLLGGGSAAFFIACFGLCGFAGLFSKTPFNSETSLQIPSDAYNPVARELLSNLNTPLKSIDRNQYEQLEQYIAAKDAQKIASTLSKIDPYSLFTSEELSAMEYPIGGQSISPNAGTFKSSDGEVCPIPSPLIYWSQTDDLEHDLNLVGPLILAGSFFRTIVAGQKAEEYKTVWFDRIGNQFQLDRITFHSTEGVETEIEVFDGQIFEVVCEGESKLEHFEVLKNRRVYDQESRSYVQEPYTDNDWSIRSGKRLFSIKFNDAGEYEISHADQ